MANKDKLKGGFSDKMSVESIAKKHKISVKDISAQIKKGVKVEMEHVDTEDLAREITLDHLFEIPDYYTRLEKMEKEAKKDMKEGKENITEFARRMRELAGLSDGNQKKSLKAIQEGFSSRIGADGDRIYDVYDLSIDVNSMQDLINAAKKDEELDSFLRTELSSGEGIKVNNGMIFWGSDIFDHLKKEDRLSMSENSFEDYELEDRKMQYGINPEIDDFESIDFEQEEIEEGENDSELYKLNENTIIVIDFINEEFEVDEPFVVHGYYILGNSGGYEIMLSDDGESARVRDAFGSDNPNTSEWLEVEYTEDEDGEFSSVIDPSGYNIPLNMVMRA